MAIQTNEPEIIERVVGDRDPLGAYLRDNTGAKVDLTGRTIVCRWLDITDGTQTVADAATVPDADQVANIGLVTYSPATADVATAGTFVVYFIDTTDAVDIRYPYDGAKLTMRIKSEVSR